MVAAIVFIRAEPASIAEVADAVVNLSGVSEVYSVTGEIDLIAVLRVADHEQIAAIVTDQVNRLPGIRSTETHIAFRTYSARDIEAAFTLGE